MKTLMPIPDRADFLDLLFQNRNKAYGSYELRRHYPDRLRKALLGVLFSVSAGCLAPVVANHISPNKVDGARSVTRVIDQTPLDLPPKKEEPLPLPKPQPPADIASVKFPPLHIVPNEEVRPEEARVPVDSFADKQIALVTNTGTFPGGNETLPTGPGGGSGLVEGGTGSRPNSNLIPTVVDIQPQFPGDLRDYLASRLNYPDQAREAGVEGRVVIRFVVDEKGRISQAAVVRGIGGGCDEEALRVVRGMPDWKPAQINGEVVKSYFSLPIKFTLEG